MLPAQARHSTKIGAGMSSTSYRQPDSRLDLGYPPLDSGPAGPLGALRPPRLRLRHAALAGGAVAAALVALSLRPEPAAPVLPAPPAIAPVAAAYPAPVAAPVRSDLRPAPAPAQRLVRSDPPPARPAAAPQPIVTVATRSVPLLRVPPRADAPAELRLAELTTARARMVDAEIATPLRRPAPPPPVMAARGAAPRPLPRPAAPDPAPKPVLAAAPGEARPLPRPDTPGPVRVASLAPAGGLAAAIAPMARPESVAAAPVAEPPKPKAAPPKPKAAAVPRQPRVVLTDAPAKPRTVAVRAAPPPPVQVVRPAAEPVRQAALRREEPPRTTRSPTAAGFAALEQNRARGGGRDMSLIGVFGGADGRHALVLLPNGAIERVRPGDRIRGVQVAAVGSDSVRLSDGSRETVLRLPE
jgi:hypothetical protein